MKTDLQEIQSTLQQLFNEAIPPLKVAKNNENVFEVTGNKEVLYCGKMVEGYYFASVVPKPKDIRLYFFPIYTHKPDYPELSDDLKKCLKGKSCFHIKKLTPAMEQELKEMILLGVRLYQTNNLI